VIAGAESLAGTVSSKAMRTAAIILVCVAFVSGCSAGRKPSGDPCAANMIAIWDKMDEWEGDRDRFPASLNSVGSTPQLFVCPSSGHKEGTSTNVDEWTDYIYVPSAQDWMRLDLAILICPPENHDGKYGNVLLGGRVVRRLPAAQVRALIKEPWCMPTPGRKSITISGPNGTEIPFAEYARTNITVVIPERFRSIYRQ
jgi:hypothetical protein